MAPSIEFNSFEDYFKGFHPHMMIYSFNGMGKTTLAGGSGLRTILLDCGDAGVVTLRKIAKSNKKLRIVRIRTIEHYIEVMAQINERAHLIDLVVADTVTGLQGIAIREVKGKGREMNQRKWGQAASKVIECIAETRRFPNDVIYLAQEKRKNRTDADDNTIQTIAPSLTPSVREYMSSCVDWVGRLYMEGERRKLSFILTDSVEAKDRSDLFPKVLVNPQYLPIRERIIKSISV